MGYRSQVFFMIDSDAKYKVKYDLASKFQAWINSIGYDLNVLFEQPIYVPSMDDFAQRGYGFMEDSIKWYSDVPGTHAAWLNSFMDFMDSVGLGEKYKFIRIGEDGYDDMEVRGELWCPNLVNYPTIEYQMR